MDTNINHRFTLERQETSNAYAAISDEFLPRNTPNTLVLPMNGLNAQHHHRFCSNFSSSATHLPIYHKTNTPQASPTFIAVGPHTGQPLWDWIRALTPGSIWKYGSNGDVTGLETMPMKVVNLLGAALAPIHEAGRYVGDILRLGRVEADLSRITFDNYLIHPGGQMGGIKKDIDDFKRLIRELENLEGLTNVQSNKCEASKLFKRLCDDAQNLNTVPDLVEISYFVCHNPISWGFEQRLDFVFTFYSFRELDSEDQNARGIKSRIAFDKKLVLTVAPTKFPSWKHKIVSKSVFDLILDDAEHKSSYDGTAGVMIYHRACFLHYHEKETTSPPTPFATIDANLSAMFPFALPMAWYAFYLRRKDLPTQTADLVTELKKQPGLLYYKKFR